MNSKTVGENTEAQVLAALLKNGEVVLMPFGDNQRYDLVVERDGEFIRIQCKTGRLRNGAVLFHTCSSQAHRGRGHQPYYEQADLFGVYCPETDGVYIVPVNKCGTSAMSLRVEPARNNMKPKHLAKDYEYS